MTDANQQTTDGSVPAELIGTTLRRWCPHCRRVTWQYDGRCEWVDSGDSSPQESAS